MRPLTPLQQAFLALLRYSIGAASQPPKPPKNPTAWAALFAMAQQQALSAVLLQGISRLPHDYPTPPPAPILIQWVAEAQTVRAMNEKHFRQAWQVQERLRQDGFLTCILKGQGNARLYPDPYTRSPGDIDIWLSGGRKRIITYADRLYPGQVVRYHHVDLPLLPDTPVEAHFTPSFMHAPWHNRRLQQWFAQQADEQFYHHVPWPGADGQTVAVPTTSFNAVFILSHLLHHVFTEGIGLRQLLDYYFVLTHPLMTPSTRAEAMNIIRHTGMAHFCAAIMHVLERALHLPAEAMLCEPDPREGERLLSEVMRGGNFGMYDDSLGRKQGQGWLRRNLRMELRNAGLLLRYPAEVLCEPFFRGSILLRRKLTGRK